MYTYVYSRRIEGKRKRLTELFKLHLQAAFKLQRYKDKDFSV